MTTLFGKAAYFLTTTLQIGDSIPTSGICIIHGSLFDSRTLLKIMSSILHGDNASILRECACATPGSFLGIDNCITTAKNSQNFSGIGVYRLTFPPSRNLRVLLDLQGSTWI